VNMFQAIERKCRTNSVSMHNVMAKIPSIGRACYGRERDFCMHPNFCYVLEQCDKPNRMLGVHVPLQLRLIPALSLNILVD
jgi:hypothetical protein